jgi:hypothetical protein
MGAMKSLTIFIGKYFSVLIIATLVGTVGYYLVFLSAVLIAGNFVIPSVTVVFPYIPLVLPWAAIVSCFCLITHVARQRKLYMYAVICCVIFHLCTWYLLMPQNHKLIRYFHTTDYYPEGRHEISPGFFHRTGDEVYYFFQFNQDNTGNGIFFNLASGGTSQEFAYFENKPLNVVPTQGDLLIHTEVPWGLGLVFKFIAKYQENAIHALAAGPLAWIAFGAICFPLLALLAFSHLSRWKFVNFILLCCTFVGIFIINTLYFTNFVFPFFSKTNKMFYSLLGASLLPAEVETYICLFFINIILAVIFVLSALCAYFKDKKQYRPGIDNVKT